MMNLKNMMNLLNLVLVTPLLFLAEAKADILLNVKYIIPLTPEQNQRLEAFNDYTLYHYFVDMAVVGQEKVIFQLSPDLTGGALEEIKLDVKKTEGDVRHLEGKKGEAKCTGPWSDMTCVFRFRKIKIASPHEAKEFFENKYGPSPRATGLTELVSIFQNDPIGIGKSNPLDQFCKGCDAINGVWEVGMTNFSKALRWYNFELYGSSGLFYSDTGKGELFDLTYTQDSIVGKWKADGRSGWLNVALKNKKFKGTWGLENSEKPEGRIWGERP